MIVLVEIPFEILAKSRLVGQWSTLRGQVRGIRIELQPRRAAIRESGDESDY